MKILNTVVMSDDGVLLESSDTMSHRIKQITG
jgi:hypothetical protein